MDTAGSSTEIGHSRKLILLSERISPMLPSNHFCNNFCLSQFSDDCGWCKRPVSLGSTEFLASPEGLIYCTESCFTQSRRASFKRAKTCDWCKHTRHAISYVDFQDGAKQLQFCSDKCLNQYKMQIFCKETQAHLDMNPHLKEKGSSSTNALITPDLWLKNCRSRSASPSNSDNSASSTSPTEPFQLLSTTSAKTKSNQTLQRPFITVAPVSKLISRIDHMPIRNSLHDESTPQRINNLSQSTRLMRKRRSQRLHSNAKHSGYRNITENNGIDIIKNDTTNTEPSKSASEKFKSCSTVNQQKPAQSSDIELVRQSVAKNLLLSLKSTPTKTNLLQRQQLLPPPPDLYPLNSYHRSQHQLFGLPNFGATIQSTLSSTSTENRLPTTDVATSTFQQSPIFSGFHKTSPPPMTVLVPCPIILPFPIPIPIPLPFESFLKAAKIKIESEKTKAYSIYSETPDSMLSDTNETSSTDLPNDTDDLHVDSFVEQPLDFTKETAQKVNYDALDGTTNVFIDFDSNNLHSDNSIDNKLLSSKLTSRLHAKRAISRESESSRPLRKRKRLIDSDYLLKTNI